MILMTKERFVLSVFFGSARHGRVGDVVASWIADILEKQGHVVHRINPNIYQDLLVVRAPHHRTDRPTDQLSTVHAMLEESDGFVLVTPEYNHSFSGTIKNALDNFMPEYHRKPFGIVSYSAGPFGGIRANEALRQVVSELKGVPTPLPLLVSSAHTLFSEDGVLQDPAYNDRAAKFFDDFLWYVKVLKSGRSS